MSADPKDFLDRSLAADAARFRWMLDGHGYFLEEEGLCNMEADQEEQDDARRRIDQRMIRDLATSPEPEPDCDPLDPWEHRSERMRCRTCMWFVEKKGEIGRCRRHAPTMGGYPVVLTSDWCGDHRLSERSRNG